MAQQDSGAGVRNHDEALEKAMALIKERRPEASAQKKAAFANGVAYLVSGWSGGYGGPSVREHAVNSVVNKLGASGRISFEAAVEELIKDDGVIFGPITDLHRMLWEQEYCFNDDPKDIEDLS